MTVLDGRMSEAAAVWEHRAASDPPLDTTEKGDGVKPTQQVECVIWQGRKREYQAAAAAELTACHREPSHWSWIVPTCGTELCIESEHLVVHAPLRLSYPYGVCVYCGRIAGSRDHLLPRNWTGDAKRAFVVTVPACGKCNTLLGNALTWSMTERRAIAHARLRHNMRRTLATKERSPEELAEFGSCLREYITSALSAKREVERMLSWPEDPHYDMRAMHKSGIDNPWAAGLLMVDDEELAAVVRAMT